MVTFRAWQIGKWFYLCMRASTFKSPAFRLAFHPLPQVAGMLLKGLKLPVTSVRYRSPLKTRLVEGVGFEPTIPFGMPVFKTGAFNRSATPPTS